MTYLNKQLSITVKDGRKSTGASDEQMKWFRKTIRSYHKQIKAYDSGMLSTQVLSISWSKTNNDVTITITKLSNNRKLVGKYELTVQKHSFLICNKCGYKFDDEPVKDGRCHVCGEDDFSMALNVPYTTCTCCNDAFELDSTSHDNYCQACIDAGKVKAGA